MLYRAQDASADKSNTMFQLVMVSEAARDSEKRLRRNTKIRSLYMHGTIVLPSHGVDILVSPKTKSIHISDLKLHLAYTSRIN